MKKLLLVLFVIIGLMGTLIANQKPNTRVKKERMERHVSFETKYDKQQYILDVENLKNEAKQNNSRISVYIGDPNSDDWYSDVPIDFYYDSSLSQTIYLESEIDQPNGGLITSVTLRVDRDGNTGNRTGRIYMANTMQSTLSDWIPRNQFTQVWSGNFSLTGSGLFNWTINLNEAFEYTGENLVIMWVKGGSYTSNYPDFLQTDSWSERTITFAEDGTSGNFITQVNNGNYPDYDFIDTYVPNITLNIEPAPALDYDLRGVSITGPSTTEQGISTNYIVRVDNRGELTIQGAAYSVRVLSGTEELAVLSGITIPPTGSLEFVFPLVFTDIGNITVRGWVDFPEDEVPANNYTPNLTIYVSPAGNVIVTGGNPNSTLMNENVPMNVYWEKCYSQTIYYPSDFDDIGEGPIYSLTYSYLGDPSFTSKTIFVYMANTTMTEFTSLTSWITSTNFTQVWTGNFPFNRAGMVDFTMNFSTPFQYTGGNLAIIINTQRSGSSYSAEVEFISTATPGVNRSIQKAEDGSPNYTITNPGTAAMLIQEIPNIKLMMVIGGRGTLYGYANSGTSILPGVEISINETNFSTITNEDGYYSFVNIPIGEYIFTATKEGYYSHNSPTLYINENEQTEYNFDMVYIPPTHVNIMGRVMRSDTGGPLPNASITFVGEITYDGITSNANGYYSIPNVLVDNTYTLTISRNGFRTYIDDEVIVLFDNIDLGSITLFEIAGPPANLIAEIMENRVHLTWEAPSNRVLTGYNIYFFNVINSENPNEWESLATNIEGTTYIHNGWSSIEDEGDYQYAIIAVYSNNNLSDTIFSNVITYEEPDTKIEDELIDIKKVILKANYPNPFNPSTAISFDILTPTNVSIIIYDIKGKKVKSLVNANYGNGTYKVEWNGTDENGNIMGSGIYLYKMTTDSYSSTRKMIMIK